jgi:hypothetical protein
MHINGLPILPVAQGAEASALSQAAEAISPYARSLIGPLPFAPERRRREGAVKGVAGASSHRSRHQGTCVVAGIS